MKFTEGINGELKDKSGKDWRTHDDEDCTNIMDNIISSFIDRRESIHLVKGGDVNTWITDEVSDVLINHSPELFNTLFEGQNIHQSMEGLVNEVNRWCNKTRVYEWAKKKECEEYTIYTNRSPEEKAAKLREYIDGIKGLVGKNSSLFKVDNLLDHLYTNAEMNVGPRYIRVEVKDGQAYETKKNGRMLHKPKETAIREYLESLQFKNKKEAISSFISALISNTSH